MVDCASCISWKFRGKEIRASDMGPIGECRRRAPAIESRNVGGYASKWPETWGDDWCREYEKGPDWAGFER